jgi:hypothetical protein
MAERQNFQKTRKGRCASREFARGLKVFPPKNSRARHFFGQMYEISIIFFLVKFYGCAFPTIRRKNEISGDNPFSAVVGNCGVSMGSRRFRG